jgi:hypothetical protein
MTLSASLQAPITLLVSERDTTMKTVRKQSILGAALACTLPFATTGRRAQDVNSADAQSIAQEAYTYFYPLVIMDVSRKHFTNIEAGKMFARGPIDTFLHARFRLRLSGELLTPTSTPFTRWVGSI